VRPWDPERRVVLAATLTLGALLGGCRREPLDREREERVTYRAAFHEIGGLRAGDDVRYGGLAVGAVDGVALDSADPRRLVVTFRVRKDLPVRADARATVPLVTLPVEHYLVLVPVSLDAPPLPPGAMVASVEMRSLPETMLLVSRVLDRSDTLLWAARALADAGTIEHIARATARMDTLTALASHGTRRLQPRLDRIASRTDTLLGRTNVLLATMDSSRADLAAIPGATVQTLRETRRMLAELREGLSQGGGLSNVVRDLSISGRNLARITTEMQRDPLSPLKSRGAPAKPAGPKP
jgi:phospholipid/cholesterol/gamma-HCH transport system substrate-binding protein